MKAKLNILIIFLLIIPFVSCNKNFVLPSEYIGNWESESHQVTVRNKIKGEGHQFHKGKAVNTILRINENNTASGTIGDAKFENALVLKNGGNPKITGCTYIIKCGEIGKIFEDDPLDKKEVQIWLGIYKDEVIDAELRFTQGMAHFPMAGMILKKK